MEDRNPARDICGISLFIAIVLGLMMIFKNLS